MGPLEVVQDDTGRASRPMGRMERRLLGLVHVAQGLAMVVTGGHVGWVLSYCRRSARRRSTR